MYICILNNEISKSQHFDWFFFIFEFFCKAKNKKEDEEEEKESKIYSRMIHKL